MKVRRSIMAAGAAVVLGTTGAVVLPAVASATSATHTLNFIAVTKNTVFFTKTQVGVQQTDTNKAGKIVGFDEVYVRVTSATSGAANATVDTKGGMLYATFTLNLKTGASSHGKVTGGTGAFKGATGTLKGKNISSTKTAITITYRT